MKGLRKRVRFSQFIKEMGMSRSTGYRHISNGILPKTHTIGGIAYFFVDELSEHLDRASETDQVA